MSIRKDNLRNNYIVPPFSIIDTKQGDYLKNKKKWKEKIQDNAEARIDATCLPKNIGGIDVKNEVSILDPYLCEILLHWFGINKGNNFDCFAGDSVFGFVSASKDYNFTGIELREEQAEFNLNNLKNNNLKGNYICDDGRNILKHIEQDTQDLFFSCPPYYDLEVYSDKENDASNQETYEDFLKIIEVALLNSMKCLKDDRFAIIVIGDIRDENGFYRSMEYDFINIMRKANLNLYNHIILADPLGTAPMRANNVMKNRKVVKVHQNVLVFYKGNPKNISNTYPNLALDEKVNKIIEQQELTKKLF